MHSANPVSIELVVEPGRGGADGVAGGIDQIALPLCEQARIGPKLLGKETRRNPVVAVCFEMNIEPGGFVAVAVPPQGKPGRRRELGNGLQILPNHQQPSALFWPATKILVSASLCISFTPHES